MFPVARRGNQKIHLLLNLGHALHLNVQLHVHVVEVRHDHVEHVVFVQRASHTLRPFVARRSHLSPSTSRPVIPRAPFGPRRPGSPFGPDRPRFGIPTILYKSIRAFKRVIVRRCACRESQVR